MLSPIHPRTPMIPFQLEKDLEVWQCPRSEGLWIPAARYWRWHQQLPPDEQIPLAEDAETPAHEPVEQDASHPLRPVLFCPESGCLLLRYRVGHGLSFLIDHSPKTGGVWLDKGEWEELKERGLHANLHLIFTTHYQQTIAREKVRHMLEHSFAERIGDQDYPKVAEFREWMEKHPSARDILCYLIESYRETI